MLKKTLVRFAVLLALCTVAVLLLRPPQDPAACALMALGLAFFVYAFAWARGPLAWLAAFTGKYGFLALLFGSVPGLVLVALVFALGLPLLCTAAVLTGALRFAFNIGYALYLDRTACPPAPEHNHIDL